MTGPQERAVRALVDMVPMGQVRGVTPWEFAKALWPESEGWKTSPRRYDGRAGGMGATMPMLGAKMLRTLVDLGMAARRHHGGPNIMDWDYRPTPKARKWVTDQGELL